LAILQVAAGRPCGLPDPSCRGPCRVRAGDPLGPNKLRCGNGFGFVTATARSLAQGLLQGKTVGAGRAVACERGGVRYISA